jgi:hypothetical protein
MPYKFNPFTGNLDKVSTSDHGSLTGLADDDHPQYILHSLADAANDFLIASGDNIFIKKTLAETGAILETDIDHGNIQGLGDGSDHSFIDQDVTSGSSPTFDGTNITGVASIDLLDESSDTICYVVFANSPTGAQALKTGTNLTFNASTGAFKADGDLWSTGHVAFGSSGSPQSGTVLTILENTDLTTSNFHAILGLPVLTANSNTNYVAVALQFPLVLLGTGSLTNTTGQWGVDSGVNNYNSGTTALEGGMRLTLFSTGGTHTHMSGLTIASTLGGTITTFKGLEIKTHTGATTPTNFYGVYQEDTAMTNYFAGDIQIDDNALRFQEGSDTLSITVPTLTADRAVTLPDAAGEITLLGQTIDISSDTNLVAGDYCSLDGDTLDVAAASDTTVGAVELATIAETDTGTDATRAITPDGLQGSIRNIRWLAFRIIHPDIDCVTDTDLIGDFVVPFDCTLLQDDSNPEWFSAATDTAGTTGTMVVDVHLNGTTIMTTNKLDIETAEKSTTTAATQPDLTTTDVSAGDILTFDIDAVHTTEAKGLTVYMAVRLD